MNTEVRKIVLVPRFTTYAGARTFLTEAINVRAFAYADVAAWRGTGIGASPSFLIQLQVSNDLDVWLDQDSSFDASGEVQKHFDLTAEWMRLAITLGGTEPAFTCWVVGDFATRMPWSHGGRS